ncbi:MAG: glycine betaine ABC transporter substrate-binding protein [Acidobacteriia bacterium]|nr:glycine betaine ABC transporter substrate-binding protein [Terriglobia bacterium]
MGLIHFLIQHRAEVVALTTQHLLLVLLGTGAGVLTGVPIGILLTRRPGARKPVLAVANIFQTIPSLALFGFLIPLLGSYGIGRVPAIIALFIYSLLPILQNTSTGISGVDPAVREAAVGMGLTDWQLLTMVEFPLALPVIIAGIRVATVISVGTATIAAAIGAGGLGTFIFRGLRMNDNQLILAGAVPAALMALAADVGLGWLERSLGPSRSQKGVKVFKWVPALVLIVVLLIGVVIWNRHDGLQPNGRVVIGSKDFTEQVILGELLSQQIERYTGLAVERRFELGGDLCHRALVAGEIDAYVEYSGTAFTAILKHPPLADAREVENQVRREYAERFNLVWLPSLGFNDTFAILIRADDARRWNVRTLSDAAKVSSQWRAGFGQDFMSRPDGFAGFAKTYHLNFNGPPREMDLSLTYRALADHQVDLIAGNSTDGRIDQLHLVQLHDDRHYFPPYEAAPVVREETLNRYPRVRTALEILAGKISDADMRRLNLAVDEKHRDPRDVVKEFLSSLSTSH